MGNQTNQDKDGDNPGYPSRSEIPEKQRDVEKPRRDNALDAEEPELPEGEDVPRKDPPQQPAVRKNR